MKTFKQTEKELEKEIKENEDFMVNPEPETMKEAFECDEEMFMNSYDGLILKAKLSQLKIDKEIAREMCDEIIKQEEKFFENKKDEHSPDIVKSQLEGVLMGFMFVKQKIKEAFE